MRANLRIVQSCCPGAHLFIHYRPGGRPTPGRGGVEGGRREEGSWGDRRRLVVLFMLVKWSCFVILEERSCLVVSFRLQERSGLVVFLFRLEERSCLVVLFRLAERSCLVVWFRLQERSCFVVFLFRLAETTPLRSLNKTTTTRRLIQTGEEELSCSDLKTKVVFFRLEERSCLVQTGGEELPCSDWRRGVALFRLVDRSCLVQTGGEEMSCSDWRRGVVLFRLRNRS
jgi:hypothetical protein